jgi:glycosyltransferase involved in cell wall biosynthesis
MVPHDELPGADQVRPPPGPPQRIAFLGDYVPRLCGIATFTRDLCEAVSAAGAPAECYAGAVNDRAESYEYPPRVRFQIQERDVDSYRRAADWLNFRNADVLCVQHEFGIYGGPAGSHLLALLKEVRMPVVTTLHTVLQEPNDTQRRVMQEVAQRSARLVVMAEKGSEILQETFGVEAEKIRVIPHGIPDIGSHHSSEAKSQFGVEGRTVLLTFGLLGPGKGIEHVIEALPEIVRTHPEVVYIILGATHPHLLAREGERYRIGLEWLAEKRGVKEHVIFYNQYVPPEDLEQFIRATDIYLTPYLNAAQITSGTLAQVFGAGKAVISTPYWHARELLAEDRGTLVPFADSAAITAAVIDYLSHPRKLEKAGRVAWQAGRSMIWPAVAERYLETFAEVCAERRSEPRAAFGGWTAAVRSYDLPPLHLDHVVRMTDGTGMFQHAIYTVPDFAHGYCTDDNARAFLLCNLVDEMGGHPSAERLHPLSSTYLAFLHAALNRDRGRFRNFMSFDRKWLEEVGSEDSHGRAMWALGTGVAHSLCQGQKQLCARLVEDGLAAVAAFTSPRAWAFTLLGIHEYLQEYPESGAAKAARDVLTGDLLQLWNHCAAEDWPWFESSVTYENARLSQALLLSGRAMHDTAALDAGLKSLRWLTSLQKTQAGSFRPIGSDGFHVRGGSRAHYDQQPVEAQAMVSACLEAFRCTGDPAWNREARCAFEWFLGRNDAGLPLYDAASGGCADGLHPDRINANQGAESTLAFHLALAEMSCVEHPLSVHP